MLCVCYQVIDEHNARVKESLPRNYTYGNTIGHPADYTVANKKPLAVEYSKGLAGLRCLVR
ncbi:hypothetical protein GGR92_003810 [Spirosoma lacussanchae]